MAKRALYPLWRCLPALVWMVLIFHLSSRADLPSYPAPWLDLLLKKAAHMAEYAILAMLLLRATGRSLEWALVVAFLYALSDELHQSFVPGRTARWTDVGFDFVGAVLGVMMVLRLRRRG